MPERIETREPTKQEGLNSIQRTVMEGDVIESIRTVYDPEIPVNVYDLGLIYGVRIQEDGWVHIDMTLTSPACPVAESLPIEVENVTAATNGVKGATVTLVWDPPFSLDRIPEHIRLELGLL